MPLESDANPFLLEAKKPDPNLGPNYETKGNEKFPTAKKLDPFLSPNYEIKGNEKVTIIKPQEEIEQFIERQELLLAPYEYQRKGNDPGLVLIFNQESFSDKPYRLGSRRDVNEIINCMSRLGFNINEKYIFTDYTRDDILITVNKIVSEDLSGINSLIVFFLTHGEDFNRLHAHDYSIECSDLWKNFAECPHLKNKPKMFIFQACKGGGSSTIPGESDEKFELVPESTFRTNYIGPDMLIVYSTTEGNVSYRDSKNGTWFIQELCKNFLAYGRRDDVVSLIMRTAKCLSKNYFFSDRDQIKKQMPIFVSTLRKKFYLNRYKERNIWIKMLQDQENMTKRIKDLEDTITEMLQEREKRSK